MLVVLSKAVQSLLTQPSTPRYNYRIMIFLSDLTQLQDVETLRTTDTQIKDFLIAIPRNLCCYNLFLIILNFVHVPATLRLLLYFFLALITFITIYNLWHFSYDIESHGF